MARLPGLVRAIAEHDRRGEKTIAHIARQVRDAGLISSTRRGVGASIMAFSDAATLLMGVCGDSSPQGAVAAVHHLRSLQPLPWDRVDRMKREDLAPSLAFLRDTKGFAGTLEKLIEHAPEVERWHGTYAAKASEQEGLSEAEFSARRVAKKLTSAVKRGTPGYGRLVRIVCYVPGVAAEIHLGNPWLSLGEDDAFHEYYAVPDRAAEDADATLMDCSITIEVGLPTLLALHEAVVRP
ncbi:hypothetical protein CSW62_02270 [Caulobacter sp. FWC2]|nr:hypothetical protein CSW62_02270 [Caulobacter sp. FWC2]